MGDRRADDPAGRHGGRRRSVNVREVLNGIFYVLWTGCQWKALPKDLPPKSTVHDYLELWNWDGTLERIHHGSTWRCASRLDGNHRLADREGRSKRGSWLDPSGYDAGKSAPRRRVSPMEEDSIQTVVD